MLHFMFGFNFHFMAWALCYKDYPYKGQDYLYTAFSSKKTLHFRNIKSLEFGEGTLIIASKLSGKIEINLNSIKDKDVKILIERLEKEVDSNGG